jgi:hypothetical protein
MNLKRINPEDHPHRQFSTIRLSVEGQDFATYLSFPPLLSA